MNSEDLKAPEEDHDPSGLKLGSSPTNLKDPGDELATAPSKVKLGKL
jgi:hypothetical protein